VRRQVNAEQLDNRLLPEMQGPASVALHESECRYRTIVETTREGVWVIDAAGITTFVNQRMADLIGYGVDEMTGRPLFDFLDDAGRQIATESLGQHRDGLDIQLDFRLTRRDGTDLWTSISASPIQGADGNYEGALAMFTDITKRKLAEAELAHSTRHDRLTGLPNRILLVERLETAAQRSFQKRTRLAVLFCDLDRFKVINDSMGHAAGDSVLATVAERLRGAIRPGDTVARIGDDEFVLFCEGLENDAEPTRIADRVSAVLAKPVAVEGREVFVTASTGVRVLAAAYEPAESLLRDADAAMYQAKRSGGDSSYVFDESLRAQQGTRLEIECDLHRASERGELRVHYQPVVSLNDGVIAGVEALLRWEHPGKGMMCPADFIGIAEESGLIVPMGLWVLDQACEQLRRWTELGARPLTMAVNVSPRQLRSPEFASQVAAIISRTGVSPGDLCLEVTETVLIEDAGIADELLASLTALGVRIALDDFGTGYSSLNHLHQFPVDILKVDRSFIANLGSEVEATAIATTIFYLARALDLEVVAEGVETPEQLDRLRLLGCRLAQGYLWSRPVPPEELDNWLKPLIDSNPAGAPEPDGKLTVLLADDEAVYRSTVKRILERSGRFSIVAEAHDGQMAVELSERHHPDLVLLDLSMPKMGGFEALPRILAGSPGTKVAVLSGEIGIDGDDPIPQGASACLGKVVSPSELVDSLLLVTRH
jgi:diguanylate cyclase (GGDEF)-like protein/PAS domain S-box-containing protein